jgi:hypothetical protein
MRRIVFSALSLAALGFLAFTARGAMHQQKVLLTAFKGMYAVDGPFVGANPIRGVIGDEAAWVLKSAHGSLTSDGHLTVSVKGLIFKDGTPNDETQFKALVSCISEDDPNNPVNVETEGFPTGPKGDANINAHLTLPNPCIAPVVFIMAGSEVKWFAVSGFENAGSGS